MEFIELAELCDKGSSNLAQKDLVFDSGIYPVYGASGEITKVDFFHQGKPYLGLIKDGAGVGRVMQLPANSSVIGTIQYIFPKENIDLKYLYYLIKYLDLGKSNTGATIPHIYFKDYKKRKVKVREYSEQKHIGQILELIDSHLRTYKKVLEQYDLLIKSRFVDMFGDPVLNEKGWNLTSLESVCQSIYGGGTPSKKIKEYYMGTIPWVTSKDMKSDIIVDSIEHITQEAIDNSSTKIIPPESVLIVIRSGILKHTLPVCINKSKVTINQDLKALVLDERCKGIYLQYLLKALEKDILSGVRAVTADNIEFNSLKKREIPIPPIDIQIKFSQMVNQINKLKSDVQKSIDETQLLMDSLMQEYFG